MASTAIDAVPLARGHWPRRSNYGRNTFIPAATAAGWPRTPTGLNHRATQDLYISPDGDLYERFCRATS